MNTATTNARLLRVREVAELFSCSQKHVYRLVDRGEIPSIRIGTAIRFHPDVVNKIYRSAAQA